MTIGEKPIGSASASNEFDIIDDAVIIARLYIKINQHR